MWIMLSICAPRTSCPKLPSHGDFRCYLFGDNLHCTQSAVASVNVFVRAQVYLLAHCFVCEFAPYAGP